MNKFRPFHSAATAEEIPHEYQQVRFIRDACKSFSDVFKGEKDFLSKNVEYEMTKIFSEYLSSETGHPLKPTSILFETMEKILELNRKVDSQRRILFEQTRKLADKAKEKQAEIRKTITEHRDQFERAKKKYESANANRQKFDRQDNSVKINYDKLQELESERTQCLMNQTTAHDQYLTHIYRFAADEYSITKEYFLEYLKLQGTFYHQIFQIFQEEVPKLEDKLDIYPFAPVFHCDLHEHCLKRVQSKIAYPIDVTIHLLQDSIDEEGLFRQGPSIVKQRKLVTQLDLQLISKNSKLKDVTNDPHVPANVLKQYLRELPDPLLTNALFPYWSQILSINSDDQRFKLIFDLIRRLPKVNFDNLRFLMEFLNRVAKEKDKNKMTPNNLGICIGSSLLPSKENSNDSSTSSYTTAGMVTELMISHFDQLFPKEFSETSEILLSNPRIGINSVDLISPARTSTRSNSSQSSEDLLQSSISSQSTPSKPRKTRAAPLPPILTRSQSIQNATNQTKHSKVEEKDKTNEISQRSGSYANELNDEKFFDEQFHPSDSGLSRSSDNDLLISFEDSLSSNVSNEDKDLKLSKSSILDEPIPSEVKQRTSLRRNLHPSIINDQSAINQYEVTQF